MSACSMLEIEKATRHVCRIAPWSAKPRVPWSPTSSSKFLLPLVYLESNGVTVKPDVSDEEKWHQAGWR